MRTVIIGGGSLDTETAIRVIQKEKSVIIAADRGLDYCRLLHIKPTIAVGDFDSVSTGTKMLLGKYEQSGIRIVRLNPIKDDTDLEVALDIAMNMGKGGIDILGATGTRIDHVLGNLSLLRLAHEKNKTATIYDSKNRIRYLASGDSLTIRKSEQYGRYVSLIPYRGMCRGVNASGVYYPLENAVIGDDEHYYTLTISNEITAEEAHFSVEKGELLVIEAKD